MAGEGNPEAVEKYFASLFSRKDPKDCVDDSTTPVYILTRSGARFVLDLRISAICSIGERQTHSANNLRVPRSQLIGTRAWPDGVRYLLNE